MNTCQIIFLSVIMAASAEETPRWTGPFADHKLGHLVQDTPEVAAAKMHHALAHTQIRAILPELPPEDTAEEELNVVSQPRPVFPAHDVPQVPQIQPQVVPQARSVIPQVAQPRPVFPAHDVPQVLVPQARSVAQPRPVFSVHDVPQVPLVQPQARAVPQQLAEEIPRSPLGEVPEVEAARKAHLEAILEAVALNQRLGGDEPSTFRPHALGRRAGLFPLRH